MGRVFSVSYARPGNRNGTGISLQGLISVLLIVIGLLPPLEAAPRQLVARGTGGAVSTGHPLASRAAQKMLERGGNAVDAAVAAGFTLGVVDPSNSGLGGDGHALLHVDGSTTAWIGASPPPRQGFISSSSIGLPTEVPLLLALHRQYGKLNLSEVLSPAIHYAQSGFPVSPALEQQIMKKLPTWTNPVTLRTFAPANRPLRAGEKLKQPALAATLRGIARDNGADFLNGETSRTLARELAEHKTGYDLDDLTRWAPQRSAPVSCHIGPWELRGVPPPASSIVVMAMLAELQMARRSPHDPLFLPLFLEILEQALEQKFLHLGECQADPGKFFRLPLRRQLPARGTKDKSPLLLPAVPPTPTSLPQTTTTTPPAAPGTKTTSSLQPTMPLTTPRHRPPTEPAELSDLADAGPADGRGETTHLVVWDRHGMTISMTLTLGRHFGTGQYSSLGFFFNSQGDSFQKPYARYTPAYRRESGSITAKSPLLVLRNNIPVLAIGGAGENRIIANLAMILSRLFAGEPLDQAVHAPRAFIDPLTRKVNLEWGWPEAATAAVRRDYSQVKIGNPGDDYFGLIAAVAASGAHLLAVGDYRRDGCAAAVSQDPDRTREFSLSYFLHRSKGLATFTLAFPLASERQTVTRLPSADAAWQEHSEGHNRFITARFEGKQTAAELRQTVQIRPVAPASNSSSRDDPAHWQKPPKPGARERLFFQKIPPHLHGREFIQWVLVEVGHGIPYHSVKGTISGEELLRRQSGDCSGKARLIHHLLRLKGFPARLVGGILLKSGWKEVTHLWNEVYLDGGWVPLCSVNHVFGRIPAHWLVMRYGDTRSYYGKGKIHFRITEKKP
jgi:gamma-glutamyltranspeptidase/glutathione hydrolase